jgi:hypothetical protein
MGTVNISVRDESGALTVSRRMEVIMRKHCSSIGTGGSNRSVVDNKAGKYISSYSS